MSVTATTGWEARKWMARRRSPQTRLTAAAFLAVFWLGAGATAADSPVQLKGNATMEAEGAAIFVPIQVACQGKGGPVLLGVQVTQRTGEELTSGSGAADQGVVCDGKLHTVDVFVQAQGRPFHPGVAAARVDLSECDIDGASCKNATDIGDITIH